MAFLAKTPLTTEIKAQINGVFCVLINGKICTALLTTAVTAWGEETAHIEYDYTAINPYFTSTQISSMFHLCCRLPILLFISSCHPVFLILFTLFCVLPVTFLCILIFFLQSDAQILFLFELFFSPSDSRSLKTFSVAAASPSGQQTSSATGLTSYIQWKRSPPAILTRIHFSAGLQQLYGSSNVA